MNFQIVEDAIRAWVKTATGFTDAQIYFANQNGPQPAALPFIAILISENTRALGAYDELQNFQDLTRPNGQEIEIRVSGQREINVSLQAFAENTVTYPVPTLPVVLPGTQGRTAVDLLMQAQIALVLPSVRDALNAANLAPYNQGQVRRVDALVETYFEGRAILEVQMYLTDQASDSSGYIHEVTGTGTLVGDGETRTIPLDVVGS